MRFFILLALVAGSVVGGDDELCMCASLSRPVCVKETMRSYDNVCWARCDGVSEDAWVYGNCLEQSTVLARGLSGTTHSPTHAPTDHSSTAADHSTTVTAHAGAAHSANKDGSCGTSTATAASSSHGSRRLSSSGGPHAIVAIVFFFFALLMGVATQHFLSRFMPNLPYTAVILVEGIALAAFHNGVNKNLGTLSDSIDMWVHIDAHLLLYVFLPALLFGDAYKMNPHHVKTCFWPCFILAGPGVFIGTLLTTLVAKFILPYDWDWNLSWTFGSILAATDPVAVVSLLKEVGAAPSLTMLIAGESLMNDGTAIVIFNIVSAKYSGEVFTTVEIIKLLLKMALGGVALGLAFGLITVAWISRFSRITTNEHDSLLQLTLTLAAAYLSFFVGEHSCGVSGVLCTVSCATTLSFFVWPMVLNEESMDTVWETIEYIGNTLIFMLAGLIIGDVLVNSHHLKGEDFGWLLVLYLSMLLIRGAMVLFLYPAISRLGYGLKPKEAIVLTWGGLRGAVGLALAVSMKTGAMLEKNDCVNSERLVFHVGMLALMTLVINGTTTGALLNYFGMTRVSHAKEVLLEDIDDKMERYMLGKWKSMEKSIALNLHRLLKGREAAEDIDEEHDVFCGLHGYDGDMVISFCSSLRAGINQSGSGQHKSSLAEGIALSRGDSFAAAATGLVQQKQGSQTASSVTHKSGENAVLKDRHLHRIGGAKTGKFRKFIAKVVTAARVAKGDSVPSGERVDEVLQKVMQPVRELFLHVVKQSYWEQMEKHILPKRSMVCEMLLTSVYVAEDDLSSGLNDWKDLKPTSKTGCMSELLGLQDHIQRKLHSMVAKNDISSVYSQEESLVYLFTCFIVAQQTAQHTIADLFKSPDGEPDEHVQRILEESETHVKEAEEMLAQLTPTVVVMVKSKIVAAVLLNQQVAYLTKLEQEGILTSKEAEELLEVVVRDKAKINRHCMTHATGKNAARALKNSSVAPAPVSVPADAGEIQAASPSGAGGTGENKPLSPQRTVLPKLVREPNEDESEGPANSPNNKGPPVSSALQHGMDEGLDSGENTRLKDAVEGPPPGDLTLSKD